MASRITEDVFRGLSEDNLLNELDYLQLFQGIGDI